MLTLQEIKDIFAKRNAIITGDHFVYAKKPDGWYHGYDYVNKDAIYPFTGAVSELCREIAHHFCEFKVEAVVGPTIGAVSLSQWTAYWLGRALQQEILAVFADEEDVLEERELELIRATEEFSAYGRVRIEWRPEFKGNISKIHFFEKVGTRRVIKRGYDSHVKDKRCLVVEDIINSGLTVQKTIDAVSRAGGQVVGVGCLCNRSGGKVTAQTLGAPELFSLLDLDMKMFKEEECPICKERGPLSVRVDLGKGKEFLARRGLL